MSNEITFNMSIFSSAYPVELERVEVTVDESFFDDLNSLCEYNEKFNVKDFSLTLNRNKYFKVKYKLFGYDEKLHSEVLLRETPEGEETNLSIDLTVMVKTGSFALFFYGDDIETFNLATHFILPEKIKR